MASSMVKEEVMELDEELDTNYPVNIEPQKPGSSAKFYATEGQSQELLMTSFERLINHFDSRLEEKKEIESLKTVLEKQSKEKEMKNLLKEAVAEFNTHKREMQTLKTENLKLTTELASCNNDARTEFNNMMTVKEEAIKKLRNDIKMEKARTASVEQQLKEEKCTITKFEEKVKEAEQCIKLLLSENAALQQRIAEQQTQCDELRREKLQKEDLDRNKKEIENLKSLIVNNHSVRKLNQVEVQSNLSEDSTILFMQDNKINYVAPGTFDNLSSLTELSLFGCGLTFLEKGVFNNLTNLIHLYLNNNNLTCLEGNVFAGLKKLKKIYLYKNNITKLPPQLFRELESLNLINLSGNNISVFDEDLLVGLNRLTDFYAYENNLTNIPEKLFEDCVKLEVVWLFNNKIVRLEKTTFDSLHNLKSLDLHNNPLNEMDKNALRMLKIRNLRM